MGWNLGDFRVLEEYSGMKILVFSTQCICNSIITTGSFLKKLDLVYCLFLTLPEWLLTYGETTPKKKINACYSWKEKGNFVPQKILSCLFFSSFSQSKMREKRENMCIRMLASKGNPETSAIFSSKGKAWFCCLVKVLISKCSSRTNKVFKKSSVWVAPQSTN